MKPCRALLWASILGALSALLISPTAAADSRSSSSAQHLVEMLRDAQSQYGLSAVLCGVWMGNEELLTTALGNSMTGVPATEDMHLRVGGVTFTCVATLLLRLVDQGRVSLDDKLSRWYPDLPQANAVTLRMLANCTSGYPDYVLSQPFIDANNRAPFRDWTPQELIDGRPAEHA